MEACVQLGLGISQLNLLIGRGRLESRMRPRAGMAPIGVVNPRDIERERQERQAAAIAAHVAPADLASKAVAVTAPAPPALRVEDADARRLAFLNLREKPHWLRYGEAAALSGLGETRLRELVKAGKIRAERGPHGVAVLNRIDIECHGT